LYGNKEIGSEKIRKDNGTQIKRETENEQEYEHVTNKK
jgi:hypothetical protein